MKLLRLSPRLSGLAVGRNRNKGSSSRGSLDDDASIHSTFTAGNSCEFAAPTSPSNRRRRRVHFNEHANVAHESEPMDDDECEDRWWTAEEMREFKQVSIFIAKEIYKIDAACPKSYTYTTVVQRAYHACCRAAESTADNALPLCPALTAQERHELAVWCQGHTTRTGLERLCIKDISTNKRACRKRIAAAVVVAQCTRQGTPEHVRLVSQSISLASRLFARELARAQCADLA